MSTEMQEPAYILKNGQSVPYIPLEVKTARDAYSASLHVLFKHVADFHICIVKTFSAKYGIPEDDILKTIQESEEFKNMQVDPVLDMGMQSLGYLDEVPEVPTTTTISKPAVTKPNAKKTKTHPPVAVDMQVPVSKLNAKNTEPVVVESHVNLEETPAKITKIIRKKAVVPKPATDAQIESASSVPTPTTATASSVPITTTTSTALAPEGDVLRKIIKKKTNTATTMKPT